MPQLYDVTSECVRNDHHETGGWRIIYLFCGNEVAVTIGCSYGQAEVVINYLNIYLQIGTNHLNKNYSWLAVVFIQMVCPNLYFVF